MKRFFLRFTLFFLFAAFYTPAIWAADTALSDEDPEYNTPGNGSLTDANIHFTGRWDRTNPTYFHGHWAAASVRVDFTGTSIKINLANANLIYLVVQIDNETPRAVLAQDGTNLNATALTPGRHTVTVGAAIGGSEMLFKGFTLDAGAVTYKSEKKLLIEYIGDSITESGGPSGMYAYNYSWRLSNMLGCDHTQIASSAIALCSGYSVSEADRVGMDSLYFGLKNYKYSYDTNLDHSFVPWDFSLYTPDIVFMFLGTNDSDGVPWIYNATDEVFSARLDKFLKRIRGKFPEAHIAVMNPFTGVFKNVINAKIREIRASGEEKVYFINSTGWLEKQNDFISDGIHLNEQGTVKLINKLYAILNPMVQSIKDGTDYEWIDEPDTAEKFYFIPSADWSSANATFSAIFKNGNVEERVAFSRNDATGMYEAYIPEGNWTQISIRRYSPNGIGDWGGFATLNGGVYTTNFIPFDASFNCIEVLGWADGTNPDAYILSRYPVTSSDGISIIEDLSIYTENNHLTVLFPGTAAVKLYSLTGQLLYSGSATEKFAYSLNRGTYLLGINRKIYKVLIP
jgi:lysophospholipase L1-like esterase